MDTSRHYRLAPAVAIRPERFGGLIYHHSRRGLYCLRSRPLADFVRGLDGSRPLGEALDDFVTASALPEASRAALLQGLAQLERLDLFDEL
jgi:putative mycofactocin binding protein MftB